MRIVDCFTNVILYARRFSRGERETEVVDEVRSELKRLISESKQLARDSGIADEVYDTAQYPVIAFVDELLLCSDWEDKSGWQQEPLQRFYFN